MHLLNVVINLSDQTLPKAQESVLQKGLPFVPTNKLNAFRLKVDCYTFFRKLHFKNFFQKQSALPADTTTAASDSLSKLKTSQLSTLLVCLNQHLLQNI